MILGSSAVLGHRAQVQCKKQCVEIVYIEIYIVVVIPLGSKTIHLPRKRLAH